MTKFNVLILESIGHIYSCSECQSPATLSLGETDINSTLYDLHLISKMIQK